MPSVTRIAVTIPSYPPIIPALLGQNPRKYVSSSTHIGGMLMPQKFVWASAT